MMKLAKTTLALGMVSALVLTGSAIADKITIDQLSVSLTDAVAIAQQEMPGTVIEAEAESEDGKVVWEIELQNDQGQVYEISIDATSGEVLEIEEDD